MKGMVRPIAYLEIFVPVGIFEPGNPAIHHGAGVSAVICEQIVESLDRVAESWLDLGPRFLAFVNEDGVVVAHREIWSALHQLNLCGKLVGRGPPVVAFACGHELSAAK